MPDQPRPPAAADVAGAVSHDYPGQPRRKRRRRTPGEVSQAIVALAARQGGVFEHQQLLRLGESRGAIEHRLATGRYVRHHRGVYGLAGAPIGARGREFAALLAGGPSAGVSHRAAGAHWRMRPYTAPMEITVPGPRRRSRPGLRIHTQPPFADGDIVIRAGIRVTSPVRTLLDLAGVEPPDAVARAAAEAQVLRLITAAEFRSAAMASRRRPGVAALLAAIDDVATAPTQSELERQMLRLIRDAGLPMPLVGATIAGHRADFAWPEQRLIVETDGWAAHGNRGAFERDRARDVAHALAGWRVVRFTARRIGGRPLQVASELGGLLRARPPGRRSAA